MGGQTSKANVGMADIEGERVWTTAPLEEFITADKFWENYEQHARAGVNVGLGGYLVGVNVKSLDVTELEGGGFRVANVVNGGVFGEMDAKFLFEHFFDKEAREWTTKVYHLDFSPEELKEVVHLKELSAPFRLEIWSIAEKRRTTDLVPIGDWLWQTTLDRLGSEQKIKCEADATSSIDGKPCTTSPVLEVPADQFLGEYVKFLKEGIPKPNAVSFKMKEDSGNKWIMQYTYEGGAVAQDLLVFDAAEDTIIAYTYDCDGELNEQSCWDKYITKIVREPFRLEIFQETIPGRKVKYETLVAVQAAIDTCIDMQADGSSSWFG